MPRDELDAEHMIDLSPDILRFVRCPPPGSATARAKAFGYDVVAIAIKLGTTTPDERLTALDQRIEDMRALRDGMV